MNVRSGAIRLPHSGLPRAAAPGRPVRLSHAAPDSAFIKWTRDWNKYARPGSEMKHFNCILGQGAFADSLFAEYTRIQPDGHAMRERVRLTLRNGKILWRNAKETRLPHTHWPHSSWDRTGQWNCFRFSKAPGDFEKILVDPHSGKESKFDTPRIRTAHSNHKFDSIIANVRLKDTATNWSLAPSNHGVEIRAMRGGKDIRLWQESFSYPTHAFFVPPTAGQVIPHPELFVAETKSSLGHSKSTRIRYYRFASPTPDAQTLPLWESEIARHNGIAFNTTARGNPVIVVGHKSRFGSRFEATILDRFHGTLKWSAEIETDAEGPLVPLLTDAGQLILAGDRHIFGMATPGV